MFQLRIAFTQDEVTVKEIIVPVESFETGTLTFQDMAIKALKRSRFASHDSIEMESFSYEKVGKSLTPA